MSGYSRLARNTAARKALLRDLITDLILNGSIQTTEAKAKDPQTTIKSSGYFVLVSSIAFL